MSDWIKCSDRLPEQIKGDYLIVCEGGEIALSEWIEDGGPDGEWGFWYDWDATHWQPLPAPPHRITHPGGTMARTYEYWTVKDSEDIAIKLTVAYYSARKGNFSSQAADPDEYFGHCEINWESKDDTSFMTESEIASMEEWLVNEHSEYLADQDYYD